FGCDDPPNDPGSDPALPVNFTAASLAGKAECRRAIARRCSLALGPRTLLLTTGPLHRDGGAEAILAGIERLAPFDVATIIVPRGDAEGVERARLLALKQPGRVALFPGVDAADERLARGAADAILLGDDHDRIGRAAGLALPYGTLPIAPEACASGPPPPSSRRRSRRTATTSWTTTPPRGPDTPFCTAPPRPSRLRARSEGRARCAQTATCGRCL